MFIDILDNTMYKDLDLSTGSVSYLGAESKYIDNIRDKANLVSNKDLNKQLEAYEEAYAIVKEKGGFAQHSTCRGSWGSSTAEEYVAPDSDASCDVLPSFLVL